MNDLHDNGGKKESNMADIEHEALFRAGRFWERSDVARPILGLVMKWRGYIYVCGSLLLINVGYLNYRTFSNLTFLLALAGAAWSTTVYVTRNQRRDRDRAVLSRLGFGTIELREVGAGAVLHGPRKVVAFLWGWFLSRLGVRDRHTVMTLTRRGDRFSITIDPQPPEKDRMVVMRDKDGVAHDKVPPVPPALPGSPAA